MGGLISELGQLGAGLISELGQLGGWAYEESDIAVLNRGKYLVL
jgi:hypothetical protein